MVNYRNPKYRRSKPKSCKKKIIKNCTPTTDCIREINNTQINNAKDTDVVMPMDNLIEISIIIPKHQEVCGNAIETNQFKMLLRAANNKSILFEFKKKVAGKRGDNGKNNIKIMVPFKYLRPMLCETVQCRFLV